MATCICAQLILTVVVLQILQLSNSAALAGSGQCEREVAILDKSGDYTFHFKACRSNDPASVCHLNTQSIGCKQTHCDTILGVGSITRAQFTDGTCKGNIDYPKDDESTFNVTLYGEIFTKTGVFNCTLSYQYTSECLNLGLKHQCRTCTCSGQVNLMIVIVDLELTVVKKNNKDIIQLEKNGGDKFQLNEGVANITFECLVNISNQSLSSLDTKLNFSFEPSKNPASLKSVSCDDKVDSPMKSGNWIVTRINNTCYLQIVNISSKDDGQYGCVLSNQNANSPYSEDWSNNVTMVSSPKPEKLSLGHIVTGFVAFVIVLIVVIVLVMFVVSPAVQCGHKFYQRRRQAPRLIGQHIPHYGSVGSIDGRDLSRPVTPDPFADMDGVLVQGEAEGCDDLSEVETLLDERIPQLSQPSTSAAGRAKCKHTTKSPKVSEQQSTKSSSDEDLDPGITSDDQLVDLNLATEKDTPPSDRPVKYTCPYCEREYAEDRRHYYTRHIKERKCVPKTNGSAAISKSDKSDSTESESGSHTSSPINVFPMDSENSQEYP